MPDGMAMRAKEKTTRAERVSLDEAIARLEAGFDGDLFVDLGDGRVAKNDGHRGSEGLLQRLRGHRMMMALASGTADLSRFTKHDHGLLIAPQVQEILDAAKQKD